MVMILEAKGIELFYEAMGKEINKEVTGKTILVVMGKEMVYEVLCCQMVDMEVVTIEYDGNKLLKKGDMVGYDVADNEAKMRDGLMELL